MEFRKSIVSARCRLSARGVFAVGVLLLTHGTSHAVMVDGFVRSTSGTPIQNADLDWFNRDTDLEVDPTGDHTDATGYFSVDIPAGRYDITVFGPPSATYAAAFLDNVDLRDPQTLPPTSLTPGALLTAHVENAAGAPLSAIRFVATDASGVEAFLPNDRTDAVGDFAEIVPLGSLDVVAFDDTGVLAPAAVFGLDMTGPDDLGTLVMRTGYVVTGHVVDTGGAGLFNVDLDAVDESTGEKLFTTNDNTDFFGDFSIFLPEGAVELRYTPAPGSPFAPERRTGVVVAGPTATPDVTLFPGLQLSGVIRNASGVPLVNADVDVIDTATGEERYTPGDDTNATGAFAFLVPPGTYDVHLHPPVGVDLASAGLWDRVVAGPTALPAVNLVPGVLVTGTVTGGGNPVPAVDLDFVDVTNGKEYPTPGDDTLADGMYRVRVMPGTYDVTATPTPPSSYDPTTLFGQVLSSDTVIDIALDAAVAVGDVAPAPARRLTLAPNPFRASTVLRFEGGNALRAATVDVHDAAGRRVRTLTVPASGGEGAVVWDGRDDRGLQVAPGVYFVRLRSLQGVQVLRATRLER